MRVAILADIHANLSALTAVLEDIRRRGGVAEYWCLGDTVGYGPEPRECLALVRELKAVGVAGNHDLAAIGKLDISDFNPQAAAAVRWTAGQLSPEDAGYLGSLPLTMVRDEFTIVHGSPREPVWEYLLSTMAAQENFAYFQTPFCLIGHSHVPLIYELAGGECVLHRLSDSDSFQLGRNRYVINPGGVGQPRDGDPRASYVVHDSDTRSITNHRVPYDIAATQVRMRAHNLPERLVTRLSYGE